jgi:hypothetical protein
METTIKMTPTLLAQMLDTIRELNDRVEALESKNQTSSTKREMTTDDATRILTGDLREKTHKECMAALNLTYGQVYSARIGATFKPVFKQMVTDGMKSLWEPKRK